MGHEHLHYFAWALVFASGLYAVGGALRDAWNDRKRDLE